MSNGLNALFWSKEEGLGTFRRSLLSVDPTYFSVDLPNQSKQYGERIFAYELYHQMRTHFESIGVIHGEFRKPLLHIPHLNETRTMIPDLVLHQSGSLESNFMAVEIKSSPTVKPLEILRDIEKLEYYTRPAALNFKIGIMLIVNSCFKGLASSNRNVLKQIADILHQGPRVAIWNISVPSRNHLAGRHTHGPYKLDPQCLKILKADDLARMLTATA